MSSMDYKIISLFFSSSYLLVILLLLQSVIMLMFREEKSPEDEIKAWQFWHSRQHSVKQRILDAGKFCNSNKPIISNRLPLFTIFCNHFKSFAIICNHLQSFDVVCVGRSQRDAQHYLGHVITLSFCCYWYDDQYQGSNHSSADHEEMKICAGR